MDLRDSVLRSNHNIEEILNIYPRLRNMGYKFYLND